jgi:hypothetical protein
MGHISVRPVININLLGEINTTNQNTDHSSLFDLEVKAEKH